MPERRQPTRRRGESGMFVKESKGFEPDELDLDILRLLPDEGAKKGRYVPDALSSKQVVRTLDPTLRASIVGARMRVLRDHGCVVSLPVPGSESARHWQRTETGKRLATEGTLAEEK